MQNILNAVLQALPVNMDALGLSVATGIATAAVFGLKSLFSLLRRLAQKTSSSVDDKIVDETEAALRDQSKDI